MELSSDWKSLFPISSVFKPPLLITDSKPILGPLFFNPKPKTLSLLFTSPSLPLSFLRLPLSNSLLLFFPTGPNSDRLGFLLLSIKAFRFDTWGAKDDDVLHESTGFEYRILRIAVNPNPFPFPFPGNNHNHSTVVVGYLLASTLCSVHWIDWQHKKELALGFVILNKDLSAMLEKKHVPNGLVETVGPELFDDLCPAGLRFDTSAKNFGPNELKIYKVLKKKWSKWQEGFNLYQQFCRESKFQKQSA